LLIFENSKKKKAFYNSIGYLLVLLNLCLATWEICMCLNFRKKCSNVLCKGLLQFLCLILICYKKVCTCQHEHVKIWMHFDILYNIIIVQHANFWSDVLIEKVSLFTLIFFTYKIIKNLCTIHCYLFNKKLPLTVV